MCSSKPHRYNNSRLFIISHSSIQTKSFRTLTLPFRTLFTVCLLSSSLHYVYFDIRIFRNQDRLLIRSFLFILYFTYYFCFTNVQSVAVSLSIRSSHLCFKLISEETVQYPLLYRGQILQSSLKFFFHYNTSNFLIFLYFAYFFEKLELATSIRLRISVTRFPLSVTTICRSLNISKFLLCPLLTIVYSVFFQLILNRLHSKIWLR